MTKLLLTITVLYSLLIGIALMKPTIERTPSSCVGYAWLHLNCPRPFIATIRKVNFITEKEAYALAESAYCSIPDSREIKFRLNHSGLTYDYCIFFKEN